MHDAARVGLLGAVKCLLEHPDVDMDKVNAFGETALTLAKERGHEEIVKMLEERDAK